MPRLFVALDPSDAARRALAALQAPHRSRRDVRWVSPETLHLTLKFLGDTPDDAVDELIGSLQEVASRFPPLDLDLQGFGTFPRRGRPRVLWVGLEGDVDTLADLADAVEAATGSLGFPPEARAFHPHVTLGRVKRTTARDVIDDLRDLEHLASFRATGLVLYRSELGSDGATHTPLATASFGAQLSDDA